MFSIISNTSYPFRTNLFHSVGSIVTEGEAGNQLRYSSAAGFFNETLSASKVNVQMSISTISWLTYLGGTNSEDIFGITLAADSGVAAVRRDAKGGQKLTVAAALAAPLLEQAAVAVELLDPMVEGVRHIDIAAAIHGDGAWIVELTATTA